jgi:hypothetical protein
MRWRYLSSRVIIHRPYLLWYAMRRMPFTNLPPEKKQAIELCRDVTAELITDIASTWRAQKPCGMSGWNATWLLYQAVMVPLLSLFSDPNEPSVVEKSRHQVEMTLVALSDLRSWSQTAKRSFEVVGRIYEASKRLSPDSAEMALAPTEFQVNAFGFTMVNNPAFRPAAIDANPGNQELLMDNMFDSLTWSTGWNNLDYPFATPSDGWDYNAMNGGGGSMNFDGYFDPSLQGTNVQPNAQYGLDPNDAEGFEFP